MICKDRENVSEEQMCPQLKNLLFTETFKLHIMSLHYRNVSTVIKPEGGILKESIVVTEEVVRSSALHGTMARLFGELTEGAAADGAWILNRRDPGLLKSLDKLSATDASRVPENGTSSIAAHADHLRYGLSLFNRWSRGENAFADADYTASWRRVKVNEAEWATLRQELRKETGHWLGSLRLERDLKETELNDVIGSIVHLAYHLGAIRQINQSIRGPKATD